MARRLFVVSTFTPQPLADSPTDITDTNHMSMQTSVATQVAWITEVFLGGQAAASAPAYMQLARHSQLATAFASLTITGGSDEPSDPATADLAIPVKPFTGAPTLKPRVDAAAKLISLSFNAFGGLVRKTWNLGEGPALMGATASFGELGINNFTGGSTTAAMGGHIEYEQK